MERYGLDETRAFTFLARLSNDRNIELRTIAEGIVDDLNVMAREPDA